MARVAAAAESGAARGGRGAEGGGRRLGSFAPAAHEVTPQAAPQCVQARQPRHARASPTPPPLRGIVRGGVRGRGRRRFSSTASFASHWNVEGVVTRQEYPD
jgi:hypothetical protein